MNFVNLWTITNKSPQTSSQLVSKLHDSHAAPRPYPHQTHSYASPFARCNQCNAWGKAALGGDGGSGEGMHEGDRMGVWRWARAKGEALLRAPQAKKIWSPSGLQK